MITSFTKSNLTTLRADIEAALLAVSVKHNVNVSLGNCRFSPEEARFSKIVISPKCKSAPVIATKAGQIDPYNTLESNQYINLAYTFGLPSDGLGKKFTTWNSGKSFTIVGLKPSYRKYPVIGTDNNGRRFKFSPSVVKGGLIK